MSQFCNPATDRLVLARDLLVSLERRQGSLGIGKIEVGDDPEVPIGGGIVGVGRDRLVVRSRRILKFPTQSLCRAQLGPRDSAGGIALHCRLQRIFRLVQAAAPAQQDAQIDKGRGQLRIRHRDLFEFELGLRGVTGAHHADGPIEVSGRTGRNLSRRRCRGCGTGTRRAARRA